MFIQGDSLVKSHFWFGMLFSTGLTMAYQDYLGLEAYIERCRVCWIDLPWQVGASMAVMAVVLSAVLSVIESIAEER